MTESSQQVRALVAGIREAIDSYQEGALPLDRLVWELKSRISALEADANPEWVEELRSGWWQLEYTNAFWIESGRSDLSDDERHEVDEALDVLLPMLTEY